MEETKEIEAKFCKAFGLSSTSNDPDTSELFLKIGTVHNIADDENLLAVALEILQNSGAEIPPYDDFLELADPSSKVRKALTDIQAFQHEALALEEIPEDAATVAEVEAEIRFMQDQKRIKQYTQPEEFKADQITAERTGFDYWGGVEKKLNICLELAKETEKTRRKIVEIERKINQKRAEIGNFPYAEKVLKFVTETKPEHSQKTEKSYQEYLNANHAEELAELQKLKFDMCIPEEATQRHTYITGASGSGKSELLKVLTFAHFQNGAKPKGSSCVVIDPHGDLVAEIMRNEEYCNPDAKQRCVYLSPVLFDNKTFVINPLQPPKNATPEEKEVMAQEVCSAFEELLKGGVGGSLSVNMRALLVPCLMVLIDEGDKTLLDLKNMLLEDKDNVGEYTRLGEKSKRGFVADFFRNEFLGTHHKSTKASLVTKLNSLLINSRFYNATVGQSTIDLAAELDAQKLILLNLSKGELGADATEAIGRFVVAQLTCLAMKRQKIDKADRVPVHVLIDECQNFIGRSTEVILAEARKYGLHLTLAQQIVGQKMDDELKKIVIGNTEIKIIGKTRDDRTAAKIMEKELTDLQNLGAGKFLCRVGGNPAFSFQGSAKFVDGAGAVGDAEWAAFLEELSQSQYYQQPEEYEPMGEVVEFNPANLAG